MTRFRLYILVLAAIGGSAAIAARMAGQDEIASPLPSIGVIQAAYDSETITKNKKHDRNIQIVDAQCQQRLPKFYRCFVSFTSRIDPDARLYYDVAEVAQERNRWMLKSGICKR